jgi:hypothetical protein
VRLWWLGPQVGGFGVVNGLSWKSGADRLALCQKPRSRTSSSATPALIGCGRSGLPGKSKRLGTNETTARERLLAGLPKGRRKPSTGPRFPGASDARLTTSAAKPEFPGALPQYWNVPVRNRLFTGREDVLEKLHGELERDRRAVLSGLGGIGKTQTAIEYAHRYRNDYNAVFLIRTDTETALTAGLVEIAGVLGLPGRDAKDQKETVGAVKRWLLELDRWLLIADNADDLALVKNVLPFDGPGRILLTTRTAGTATTFSLAFEKVGGASPAAGDLLRLCAFFAPEQIPEEIFIKGAPELGENLGNLATNTLQRTQIIGQACRFSLLQRDAISKKLSIHRQVQAVLRDMMAEKGEEGVWAERAVRAVSRAFPLVEFSTWSGCERLLPQAHACAELINDWGLEFADTARLLNERALAIWEKILGPDHPKVASSLNGFATLYNSHANTHRPRPSMGGR